MQTRRHFSRRLLKTAATIGSTSLLGCSGVVNAVVASTSAVTAGGGPWHMPDEADPHRRTWMAFGASAAIWGNRLLPTVRSNLGLIAQTIARFEPVTLFVRPSELTLARAQCGPGVELVTTPLNDLWMRDTGPVFVKGPGGERAGVDFNFNGWGRKQVFDADAKVAASTLLRAGARRLATPLVLEGGGIEVDGQGTALITESCVLNDNRNPGLSKAGVEAQLKVLLGLHKIIWLPGVRGADITDGHTDFYARFTAPGVVAAHLDTDPASPDSALTQRHLNILRAATDAQGRRLEVVPIEAPLRVRPQFENKHFTAGYVNFYVCNGAVIAPEFGDARADAAAQRALQTLYPARQVVMLNIDGIAAGGGGIHCTTQQEPR